MSDENLEPCCPLLHQNTVQTMAKKPVHPVVSELEPKLEHVVEPEVEAVQEHLSIEEAKKHSEKDEEKWSSDGSRYI